MAKSIKDRMAEVHDRAMRRWKLAYAASYQIRMECLEDRRFAYIAGNQWLGGLETQFANKPRFESNKIIRSLQRIESEYRNNRITVDFRPKDGDADQEMADTLDGLYRADENESNAKEAYDNAFQEGTSGGMGAWRYRPSYEDEYDEDDDRQRICIDLIPDADSSVFFDPDSKRRDKADAKWAFILTSHDRLEYEDENGELPASISQPVQMGEWDWYRPDVVFTAEYFEVEEKTETITVWQLPATGEELKVSQADMADEDYVSSLKNQGYFQARQKKVKRKRVHAYNLDGSEVLEDYGYLPGTEIPIVPYFGNRSFIDNMERCWGHVRFTKDAQRLYNMNVSMMADVAAKGSNAKPIFAPEQVQGQIGQMWADDNVENYAYLLSNPLVINGNVVATGPMGYTQTAMVPEALKDLIQIAGSDIDDVQGDADAGQQMVSNISAKAVQLIQNKNDMQSFLYMDNFAQAMQRGGQIWYSMAKDLYTEESREMRTVGVDGSDSTVTINQPATDDDGLLQIKNDIGSGKYSVVVDVGPSFSTKRDAMVSALLQIASLFTADPDQQKLFISMAVQQMDGEGLEDLRAYLRKQLVQTGVIKPNKDEEAEMAQQQAAAANQPPDANTRLANSLADQADADAKNKTATIIKTLADAKQSAAKADQVMAETAGTQQDTLITGVQALVGALTSPEAPATVQPTAPLGLAPSAAPPPATPIGPVQ